MKLTISVILAFLVFGAGGPAKAGDFQTHLVNRPTVGDLIIPSRSFEFVVAPELPGGLAVRLAADRAVANVDDITSGVSNGIRKGDRILAVFWARADEGGTIAARLEDVSGEDPRALAKVDLTLDDNWRPHTVSMVADRDFPAWDMRVVLNFRIDSSPVEVGPILILRNLEAAEAEEPALRSLPLGRAVTAQVEVEPGVHVQAVLQLPNGKGPFPAVLLLPNQYIHGRFASQPLVSALLDNGIAVLRYGGRKGLFSDNRALLSELMADAGQMAAWLRHQPDIDARRTGVLGGGMIVATAEGPLEAGMLAPVVAGRNPDIAFVVSLAGPAEPMIDQNIRIARYWGSEEDLTSEHRNQVVSMFNALKAVAKAPPGDTETVREFIALAGGDPDSEEVIAFRQQAARREGMFYDPADDLRHIRVPVLALFAELDLQVPAKENIEALRGAVPAETPVTVMVLPGYNHAFQRAKTGNWEEEKQLKEWPVSDPALIKTIVDWVKAHSAETR